jgi:polar amino acid transport system substrate-binding protein
VERIGYRMGQQIAKIGREKPCRETNWGNSVAAIQANQIDGVWCPTLRRAQETVDFPDGHLLVRAGTRARRSAGKNWSDLDRDDVNRRHPRHRARPRAYAAAYRPRSSFQNMDEAIAAFYSGRVDGASFYHPALVMQQARVKKGAVVIPQPVVALATSAGIRREDDKTFRDFLDKEFDKYYKSGDTQKFYEEFLVSRGIDAKQAPSIVKEQWGK